MSDRVGQQLGNYRLLQLIGRGSWASVYLGEHLHLGTKAAIKVLHAELTGEGSEQLRREARTMARLSHPHIVRVLDFGVEESIPFLVMEYIPNGSLRKLHPKGTMVPPDVVVSYVRQVAEALYYIHTQKLIHRDVKPENLLLGSQHEVMLTEFDLATISQSSRSQQPQEAAGSVPYMAPEQLQGKPRAASDQYALAVVAYEWLCGDPPFSGSVQQVAMQHLSAPPPLFHEKVPGITPGMEQVVIKALAKDPAHRFSNVRDFALALEAAYQPISSWPPSRAPASESTAEGGSNRSSLFDLPTGTVTLLFTDIEGSTRLLEKLGDRYPEVLADCRRVVRSAFQEWHGREVETQGDASFVAFARASHAVLAAVEAQRSLAHHPWPDGVTVRVRMGLHTGEPSRAAEGYVGLDVHRAARIMRAAHGGQVLLSQATATLVEQDLPEDIRLRDLGEHRLKDLGRPWRLFQLVVDDLPVDYPHLHTLDEHPNNLPVQLMPFIGREQELTTVQDLLRRQDVRLLTLTGPGGSGKTRLGLQVAAEESDLFAAGAFFVNLAPISDPALVLPTIAQTLDIRQVSGRPWLDCLREALQQQQLLLLLDNFEQVVSAGGEVAALLATCQRLKVLVTSREVLHVRGEREYTVPPLALPDLKQLHDLTALAHNTAVALFLQCAQATKPDFQLTAANARAIAEICVRLDGLPLAIELAAARIKLFPPTALLARLGHGLAVLTGGARDAPARQQTLRNTIDWSYQLLHAREQRLFRRLSIFVGGCTLEAVEAVCAALDKSDEAGQVLDGVASLIDKSLLQQTEQEREEPRLVMLETIREHGLEVLASSGEEEVTRRAHAHYYLALAEKAEREIEVPQQAVWLEREHDNLRAALQWALEGGMAETALRIGTALELFWVVRGHWSEGRDVLERALARSGETSVAVRARALRTAADLASLQGDYERTVALAEESLALFRERGDVRGVIQCLFPLGMVAWETGDPRRAASLLEESLALGKQVGDKNGIASSLFLMAVMDRDQGEYAKAHALYEESLALQKELGNKLDIATCLMYLAELLYLFQGDSAAVSSLLQESLTLFKELGDKDSIASCLSLMGQLILEQGDPPSARPLLEESMVLFRETGNRWGIAQALSLLARLEARQSDYAAARALYQESLMIANEANFQTHLALGLEGLAGVVTAQGEPAWAARMWGAAESLRNARGTPIPPVYRADYERLVAAARAQLGEKAFAAAWAEGRTMTPKQALAAQGQVGVPTVIPAGSLSAPSAKAPAGLTSREVEVLRLVAQGLTDAQVAERLIISPRTVNTHLTSIFNKLGVDSRTAASRFAIEQRLV